MFREVAQNIWWIFLNQQHVDFYLGRRLSKQKETDVDPDTGNGSRIPKPKDIRASHLLTRTTRQKEK